MYYQKRVCVLYLALLILCFFLVIKLYNLSKPQTNNALTVLDGQYTSRIDVCSRNGFVYDRNGVLLSHDKIGKIALVNPSECRDEKKLAQSLGEYALVSKSGDILKKTEQGIPFTVVLCDKEIKEIDGVYTFDLYSENISIAKHFMGYYNGDGEGVTGIRESYDSLLTKQLGSTVYATFESNAKNQSMSPLVINDKNYDSRDGIITTIDKEIQEFCDSLADMVKSGAVVVSDVKSGEILAMSSFPDYDPEKIGQVLASDKGELVNRVTQSFTPGSVFKIIVAATALEADEILWDYTYTCLGEINVGEDTFRCHKRDGHGEMMLESAFANSCNTYFISLGRLLGMERIADTMRLLGLDEPTCADFVTEGGNYFVDRKNDSLSYLANISFGQGDLCLSPLDMAASINAVSTGFRVPLSVIKGEIAKGQKQNAVHGERERIFSQSTCEKMCKMMKACTWYGTGKKAAAKVDDVGGKTATAQTGRFNEDGVEYENRWFCGVYPSKNPRISICVLQDFSTANDVSPAVVFAEIVSYIVENGL